MKFLVIGGSGFVGSEVSKELLNRYGKAGNSFSFIVRSNKIKYLEFFKNVNIKITEGDITNIDSIEKEFIDTDYVFHMAANLDYSENNKKKVYDINYTGSKNVFLLSKKYKIKKIINISSAGIYHPTYNNFVKEKSILPLKHTTSYTYSKYLSYKLSKELISKGLNVINVLPVSVFGENSPLFEPLINAVKKSPIIILPSPNSRLSLVYVSDLAKNIINIFEKGKIGEDYIVSGKDLSIKEIIIKISDYLNKKILILPFPDFLASCYLTIKLLISKLFSFKFYFNKEFYSFVKGGLLAKHDKLKNNIGVIETDFNENFKKMILK